MEPGPTISSSRLLRSANQLELGLPDNVECIWLANYTIGGVAGLVGQFRASQAAGVSSAIRLIWKLTSPARPKQDSRGSGILNRRQVSTTETIAATRGPACSLPMCIQLWRPKARGAWRSRPGCYSTPARHIRGNGSAVSKASTCICTP